MEGFKKIVKMKTGGSVSKAAEYCSGGRMNKKTGGAVDKADIAQDKKIVKKAIAMHDKQEHDGEKTDLSKLRKGGRTKKETGTVKKFKKGGTIKKAEGGGVLTDLKNNILGTPEQNRVAQANMDKQAAAGSKLAQFFGGRVKKAEGGEVTKGQNANIDDDVRARAMRFIESGNRDDAETPVSKPTPVKKVATKLYKPDYSNEDLDRMDAEAANYERKRESTALARRYPEKRSPAKMIRDEAEIAQRPSLETKGERLMKGAGMTFKRGGKACK